MTRIVGKIYENTKEIKENNLRGAAAPRRGAAGGSAFVFFIFLSIFVYFANNPSHWDGNPGIGIVNPNNPKQSQFRQKPAYWKFAGSLWKAGFPDIACADFFPFFL